MYLILIYLLDGSFELVFNLQFYNDTRSNHAQKIDPTLTSQWRKKAKVCLAKTQGKLKGPNNEGAMIFPGCLEKNKEYYENAQNAYRTIT